MTIEMPVSLSPKERKILYALSEGKTVLQAVRQDAFVSKRTADEIIKRMKEKCGVKSTNQLIYFLTKNNLI